MAPNIDEIEEAIERVERDQVQLTDMSDKELILHMQILIKYSGLVVETLAKRKGVIIQ